MITPKVTLEGTGMIKLETEGLSLLEVARLHRILIEIVTHGVMAIGLGSMTMHFDDNGEVASIEALKRWRNLNKPVIPSTPL